MEGTVFRSSGVSSEEMPSPCLFLLSGSSLSEPLATMRAGSQGRGGQEDRSVGGVFGRLHAMVSQRIASLLSLPPCFCDILHADFS